MLHADARRRRLLSETRIVDRTDASILIALDDEPLATVTALSEELRFARNTVQARQRRLESDGVLAPPSARLRPEAMGLSLLAFVSIQISQGELDPTVEALSAIPEVLELHAVTGDADLIARVVARDPEDLHRVTRLIVGSYGVMRTSTSLAARELISRRMRPLLERSLE
ncbi:Lrp/AsnC family transcriptional regulator [Cryptosporangium phraense]|uniref:Lrp/AsnC family transcriptional regulator n=1 Tax=Cryptosporangium phraense TaxID=2593070 RepID=UPI0023F545E1|nr:Lrp/AsnC family transcriptional regulator [Cryptosporangium phraense]